MDYLQRVYILYLTLIGHKFMVLAEIDMKYRVFKFLFEIKVNLAPYFFVQIDQIQSKTPLTQLFHLNNLPLVLLTFT